jgi:uncharacterized membrane protein (UPF0127 family)
MWRRRKPTRRRRICVRHECVKSQDRRRACFNPKSERGTIGAPRQQTLADKLGREKPTPADQIHTLQSVDFRPAGEGTCLGAPASRRRVSAIRENAGGTPALPGWPRSLVENGRRLRQTVRVKRTNLLSLLFAAVLLAGCKNSQDAAPPPSNELPLATEAQPKLPTVKLYLGAETLDAEKALTERQQMTGMMFRTNIQDTDAMIFVFPQPFQVSFWMKNCPESISAAYLDPNGVIQEIHHLEKNDTNAVVAASANIQYVLETSDGWFGRHNVNVGMVIRTEKGSLQETFFQR